MDQESRKPPRPNYWILSYLQLGLIAELIGFSTSVDKDSGSMLAQRTMMIFGELLFGNI